ncbi:uncharacterized protein [Clytia hemisphaerica]|uniref:Cnidarian restricted protein n=1 Tax=Clytia hemisphaerica TaxID=252671 RepID=A0A7M5XFB1_9CNID
MIKILVLTLVLLAIEQVNGLSILGTCQEYDCYNAPLDCQGRGSYLTEVTGNCCSACYKAAGEPCGGIHDHLGICGGKLTCVSNPGQEHLLPVNKPTGVCRRRTAPPKTKLPKKWEKLMQSGRVTNKLRSELSKLFKKIKTLSTSVFH